MTTHKQSTKNKTSKYIIWHKTKNKALKGLFTQSFRADLGIEERKIIDIPTK